MHHQLVTGLVLLGDRGLAKRLSIVLPVITGAIRDVHGAANLFKTAWSTLDSQLCLNPDMA